MACDDRQLTQAQRAAAFGQQRTGVVRAVRPFSGSATVENLVDYINRELGPAVRSAREAVNDVFLQVADNAPSANPLAFYFSASTAASDPTVGRIRLNASPQNTATVMRVSQSNARLVDVQPWLDVMAGGPTTPLGVVTLVDAINPGRFIRWDLNTMTDQGAYWDLGITVIESSDPDPFVEDEAVVVGFISGVSAAGSTIPVAALSPIAPDTFVGNITTGIAPPAAVPLANIDSTSIIYDTVSHTMQRAALTGFAVAAQNVNATTSAEPLVSYTASANMSAERVATSSTSVTVSIATANQIDWQRAALTGDVTAPANSNATTIANDAVTNAKLANVPSGTVKGLQIDAAGPADPVDLTGAEVGELIRFATDAADIDELAVDVSGGGTFTVWTPTSNTTSARWTLNTADVILRSMELADGQELMLFNSRTSNFNITLNHNDATGGVLAGDRFFCPNGLNAVLTPGDSVMIRNAFDRAIVIGNPVSAGTGISISAASVITVDQSFSPTWTGTHSFVLPVRMTGVISPATISADQNNYNPTGWSTANVVRLITNNTTFRTITGAQAGAAGEVKYLVNLGAPTVNSGVILTLEDAASTAANRFARMSGTNYIIADGGCIIWYDGTSSRWRILSGT